MANHPLSVLIAIPNRDHRIAGEMFDSAIAVNTELLIRGIPHRWARQPGDNFPDLARNKLATYYIDDFNEFENLLFWDDDVGGDLRVFGAKIVELLERPQPVIIGVPPLKKAEVGFPVDFELDDFGRPVTQDGLILVKSIAPAGLMRIKRWVLERDKETYELFHDVVTRAVATQEYYEVFTHGIGPNRQFLGEDTAFVQTCRAAGIDVWVDPNIELTHRGTNLWRARLADFIRVPEEKGV